MLQSMTGFGQGQAANDAATVSVEARAVNHRFLDVRLRVPSAYSALESRIGEMLRAPLLRGRIDVHVKRATVRPRTSVRLDVPLATEYARAIGEASGRLGGLVDASIPMSFVLQQPGVLSVGETKVDVEAEWEPVRMATRHALDALVDMRVREGQALQESLTRSLADVREYNLQITAIGNGSPERIRSRLQSRLASLAADVPIEPARLAVEVALLADRSDFSEEVERLAAHVDQFEEACRLDEPVGRRLEFLLQEMHREVNTIGSKAVDSVVTQRVVDLKSVLERMREQVANVR